MKLATGWQKEEAREAVNTDQLFSGRGHGSNLGVKAHGFILALMSEKSVAAAARKAGISEATAYRYMKDPVFRALLQRRRDEAFTQNVARIDGLFSSALNTLDAVMNSDAEDGRVRISAAVHLVRLTIQARETLELSDRVAALEADRDGGV